MAISEHERQTFLDMSSTLGPLRIGRWFAARMAARKAVCATGSFLRANVLPIAIGLFAVWMIVFAGLLFHNGYAAGAAGTAAGVCGYLIAVLSRPSRRTGRRR